MGRMRWFTVIVSTFTLALGGSALAQAASLGQVRSVVTLGQTLSIAVPITLDDGENLAPECVRAEVTHGDVPWPSQVVRARLTQSGTGTGRVVRVTSTAIVEEPTLVVTIHAGCPIKLSRSYTLFADPPTTLASTAGVDGESSSANPASSSATAASSPTRSAATAPRRARLDPALAASSPNYTVRSSRLPVASAFDRAAPSNNVGAQPSLDARGAQVQSGAGTGARDAQGGRPRLMLDEGGVSMSRGILEAAQAQATAAQATAVAAQRAASAAEQRVRLLEGELARMRDDSKLQVEALMRMQQQLNQADQGASWLPWMTALATVSTGVALILGLRLRRQQSERERWWMTPGGAGSDAANPVAEPPASDEGPATQPPAEDDGRRPTTIASPLVEAPRPPKPAPSKAPTSSLAATMEMREAQRSVTVDEQIDLEQEADFFIALGHDDAAIDLLLAHLRNTGGSVPLPYLKLLEMYRRRGDRDDYELMRRRFNQRFNSVAPEWESDPNAGRVLEDYPSHLTRLERAWPKPIDAMAELEAMAFGRAGDQELIDLPAYQDLLFLYQLARNLHESGPSGEEEDVDVLLPLDDGDQGAPSMSVLAPLGVTAAGAAAAAPAVLGDNGLDFDLSTEAGNLGAASLPSIDITLPSIRAPLIEIEEPIKKPPTT